MNLKNLLALAFVSSLSVCCTSSYATLMNVNSNKTFDSRDEYINANFEWTKISKDKIVFLADPDLNLLSQEIVSDKLSTYYGIAGDKFVSADQLNIKSCQGQIIGLYKTLSIDKNEVKYVQLEQIPILAKLNLDKRKETLIFLYSYKLGTLSKSKIEAVIEDLQSDSKFDYRIVSLDNFAIKE